MIGKKKPQVGDVFTIPLTSDAVGFGQVVAGYKGGSIYLALFDVTAAPDQIPSLDEIVSSPVALLGLSFDAKIAVGDWPVIGRTVVSNGIPLPAYTEMVGGPRRVDVVDYSGTRRRRASASEAQRIPNRELVAPIRLERALKALKGHGPWIDEYGSLRPPSSDLTSRAVFQTA